MTDNEIIKALEHCSADDSWCDDCPYENLCTDTDITKFALDFINRQKAEIERLEKDSKRLKKVQMQLDDAMKMYSTIKAEAVKELLDKIEKQAVISEDDVYWVELDDIYNLVKEMVGENK